MPVRWIGALCTLTLAICGCAFGFESQSDTNDRLEMTSQLGRKLYALGDDDGAIHAADQKLAADPKNIDLILQLSPPARAKAAELSLCS